MKYYIDELVAQEHPYFRSAESYCFKRIKPIGTLVDVATISYLKGVKEYVWSIHSEKYGDPILGKSPSFEQAKQDCIAELKRRGWKPISKEAYERMRCLK